jgi:hypothetical protein
MTDEGISPEDQKKLDAKYAELEKEFKAAGKHEIVLKTMALLLEVDGQTYRENWTPDIAKAWWTELEKAKSARTHKQAINGLIELAFYFDQKLARKNLGLGLLLLLNEAVTRYQLVDVSLPASFDESEDPTNDAKKTVTGGKKRAQPAKVGEKAPEGAVRPDQLGKGPRRI